MAQSIWLWGCLITPKMHFLPVFELMSDSLTDTKVETNQCPLHQSILLTQGPIHENFEFLSWPFWIFSLLHLIEKCSPFLWGIIFSALWMVFPESWKRSCQNFYAHDCKCSNRISNIKSGVVRSKIELLCWKTYIRRLLTFLSSASSINKQVLLELVSKELNR